MRSPSHNAPSHSVRISNVLDPSAMDREAYDGPGEPSSRTAAHSHRRLVRADELDDAALRRETAEAFAFYRESLEDGARPLDEDQIHRLVELQGEFLRRFPGVEMPRPKLDPSSGHTFEH
jgi:hypothetical protein